MIFPIAAITPLAGIGRPSKSGPTMFNDVLITFLAVVRALETGKSEVVVAGGWIGFLVKLAGMGLLITSAGPG